MSSLFTLMRRLLWLALLGAIGGAVFNWWRSRDEVPATAPPQWPPLGSTTPHRAAAPASSGPTPTGAAAATTGSDATAEPPTSAGPTPATETAGATPGGDGERWIEPNEDGSCPISHPIKANDNSGIFHVPGGRFYDRTGAERCYADEEHAAADGYRRSKS